MCPNLQLDEQRFLDLLKDVGQIENIKNVFISSGLRMEPLLKTPQLLRKIITSHTPGALKIAPEHTEKNQLHLMHKEHPELLHQFVKECRRISSESGKKVELTPYLIISHPGSTEANARKLVKDLNKTGLQARQIQDFTPTPGTLSTAMYVAALAPHPRTPIPVPKNQSERLAQRRILERQFHRKNSAKGSIKKRKR